MDYEAFLSTKKLTVGSFGKPLDSAELHPALFGFQRDIVAWAVHKGRAAIFADVGLGKTAMQLEWARQLNAVTLIVAPLAVSQQTVAMARDLLNMDVRYIRSSSERTSECKVYITNYEMVENVYGDDIEAVILDESSILKNFSGVTKKALIKMFKNTAYRLACTATPPTFMWNKALTADQQQRMMSRSLASLAQSSAAVRWISAEPLTFDLAPLLRGFEGLIDWIVIGAASNGKQLFPPAQPLVERLLEECEVQGIAVFFKGNMRSLPYAAAHWREEFPVNQEVQS